MILDFETRPGAYAIIRDEEGRLLLTHGRALWFLPGGGLDFGEDPMDGVCREVLEESGYTVQVGRCLGATIDTCPQGLTDRDTGRSTTGPVEFLRLIFEATVSGGALRNEVDGSSSEARWVSEDAIGELPLHPSVGPALALLP